MNGIVHIGRQGAGHRAAAVTHQHKGALADAGGHVGGSVIQTRAVTCSAASARPAAGLHNVAGEGRRSSCSGTVMRRDFCGSA